MKIIVKTGAILLGCLDVAAFAVAQTAPAEARQHTSAPISGIEEVVITARKMEEFSQAVPIAISAITGDQMLKQGIQRISDLQYTIPSLTFSQTATSSFSPLVSLRGQTQGTIAISSDPSVGVYVDGVYLSGTAGLMSDALLDIDHVEVLKGPQGTLFGRNTTGGAISMFTKLPTDQMEGQLTVGLGNYNRRVTNGVFNLPIIENKAALRVVAGYSERDGFGYDTARDTRVGDQRISNLRGTLKLNPIENLEIVVRADGVSAKDNGLLVHPLYLSPTPSGTLLADMAIGGFGSNTPANQTAAVAAYNRLIATSPFKVAYNTDPFDKVSTSNLSSTVTYDLDAITLKSITAYRLTKDTRNYEVDASNLINFSSLTAVKLDQLTQEFQLTGQTLSDRLQYVLGAYYYHLDGSEDTTAIQFGNALNGNFAVTNADLTSKSWAGYGQATYALTPSVNLTGGLRYTDETKTIDAVGGGGNNATPFTCNLPSTAVSPYRVAGECLVHASTPKDNVSYSAALDWTPLQGVMLYSRTARGFKSGSINQRIVGTNPLVVALIKPEIVTDYEIGVKSDWLDQRLRLNLAGYHSIYRDIQRSSVLCNTAGTSCTSVLQNAANATINGVELEGIAIPFAGMRLGLTLAYTDPQYAKYQSGGLDNSKENFLEVPAWSYSLSAGYTMPTTVGDLHIQLDWSWRSEMDMAPQDYPGNIILSGGTPTYGGVGTPDSIRIQESYGLLNASVSLQLVDWNTDIRVFAANLLDERYYSHALGNATALGVTIGTPGAPRTIGADVTLHF